MLLFSFSAHFLGASVRASSFRKQHSHTGPGPTGRREILLGLAAFLGDSRDDCYSTWFISFLFEGVLGEFLLVALSRQASSAESEDICWGVSSAFAAFLIFLLRHFEREFLRGSIP